MGELQVNGMPVFRSRGFAHGWMRTSTPADALSTLRNLSIWAERAFGLPLDHRAIDLLQFIGNEHVAAQGTTRTEIERATGLAADEVDAVLGALRRNGLVTLDDRDASRLHGTPALHHVWEAFEERLDTAFIARHALRGALLLNKASQAALAARVERAFDRFFDLGWLYLHNWGANCYLMASLVAEVMRREGHAARLVAGRVEIAMDDHVFVVGGKGVALPGQIDGHAFCVVDECLLIDFALGVARKGFRRDLFWGVAADFQPSEDPAAVVARAEHPRAGTLSWSTDSLGEQGRQELSKTAQLVTELMLVYPRQPVTLTVAAAA